MLRPKCSQKSSAYRVYVHEIKVVLLAGIIAFITCALYSYDSQDSSFMHYTTAPAQSIYNWCGVVGAQCAAALVFMFGSAAYSLCFLLLAYMYALIKNISIDYEWDRLVASVGCMIVVAGLCCMHQIDVFHTGAAGGVIGIRFLDTLYYFFDYVGGMIGAYVLLYSCLIIAFRFSCMRSVRVVLHVGAFAYCIMREHKVVQRIGAWLYNGVYFVFYLSMRAIHVPCSMAYAFVWTLLDGSAFEGTLLMTPELMSSDDTGFDSMAAVMADSMFNSAGNRVGNISGSGNKNNNATTSIHDSFGVAHDMRSDPVRDFVDNTHTDIMHKNTMRTNDTEVSSINADNKELEKKETRMYALPPVAFFVKGKETVQDATRTQELEARAQLLQEKLERFGIKGKIVAIKRGPVITLFEYEPDIDAKLSKIVALEDDLSMALKALSIRILAPIPGRAVVGFEVANSVRADVLLADIIHSPEYTKYTGRLPLILGHDTIGNGVIVDLARMPHLLIAGSTGSGKSVGLNAMLISLLCARTPDELKLILIDPKRLEFTAYEDIAHLLFPIITHTKNAAPVLKWVATHMDERYEKMAACGARNIFDYNAYIERGGAGERMPFIVVIIDELADLMITMGKEVEDSIARITQMARAAGIHLIVATQRPSVDVITGFIKVNFPSRISFRVTSRVDSRTILDCGGADKLLGCGDMLFLDSTTARLKRVHGAYVSDAQIIQVTDHIRAERPVLYLDIVTELQKDSMNLDEKDDILYTNVLSYLDEIESLSISSLQRKFKIGYNRSARIIDQLESSGRIMPADGTKVRRIIK